MKNYCNIICRNLETGFVAKLRQQRQCHRKGRQARPDSIRARAAALWLAYAWPLVLFPLRCAMETALQLPPLSICHWQTKQNAALVGNARLAARHPKSKKRPEGRFSS
jgi:hypothetical protein